MSAWGDDPELMATFRAEVEERLASLSTGLLSLEANPRAREAVGGLFRDAHTVKGSAKMLGLDHVVSVAHLMEDLLGAVRDGRLAARQDVIGLLLASCDAVGRCMPGAPTPLDGTSLEPLVSALRAAIAGDEHVDVPVLSIDVVEEPSDEPDVDLPARGRAQADSVRVASGKVYDLIDIVGEAALGARRVEQTALGLSVLMAEHTRWAAALRQSVSRDAALPEAADLAMHRLLALGDQMTASSSGLSELIEAQMSRMALVRDGAMGLAMVPLRRVVAAFPRLVRDVAIAGGKDVVLELGGDEVELDKQVLDGIADALKHLVINAVDHGCEVAAARVVAGKPARATVRVLARSAGGHVVIEVSDDGGGINEDALRAKAVARGLLPPDSTVSGTSLLSLLFTADFSTASQITETSGRGVGLDVVKTAVDDLGGSIDITTTWGAGTTFTLTLPVTLGVMRCLVAELGDEQFAIPVTSVVESISLRDVTQSALGGLPVVLRNGASLPLLDLGETLEVCGARVPRAALVVRHGDRQIAWSVDRLQGEMELVIKDLGTFLTRVPGVAGATIAGDGNVVLLLDLRELAERALGLGRRTAPGSAVDAELPSRAGQPRARVLVVEDSVGVRELERVILEGAGYLVETAVDGLDGASRLRSDPADIVISDVEMPGMDGFALTRTIRRTKGWEDVPVVIMTSRNDDEDRRAGLDAGASAYLFKQDFDQAELVDTVRRLVGR
ncbi:MAG TPA: hybrid sensor histidine kinase/response regulator [Mycobacteriales bacterium]|nr:hybrid sensor histidine kinase/response regulator [Mycobacteriales bacterium]